LKKQKSPLQSKNAKDNNVVQTVHVEEKKPDEQKRHDYKHLKT
jgi:hypothetical protein